MNSIGDLKRLFSRHFGFPPDRVEPLSEHLGASSRILVRMVNGDARAIGAIYDVREENVAFLSFSRHFRRHGLPVPQIYAEDLGNNVYLEEDLGETTLFEFLGENRNGADVRSNVVDAYRKATAILPRFQVEASHDLDYSVCYPRDRFDRQSIAWDLSYFKYYFLKCAAVPFNEQALEDDFERLTGFLLEADCSYFMYRDFQSRNIMLRDGEPWFLDYQGGRRGALQYDIASILYDAKADLSAQLRDELLDAYLEALGGFIDLDRTRFMRHYYGYVLVRIMQALGAYGYRGFFEGKPLFRASVPYALENVGWLLENVELPVELPALVAAFRFTIDSGRFPLRQEQAAGLTVRLFSFSFHQGHPVDETGHGGGFVFDARNLPDPAREERYRDLSGKDAPVMEYFGREECVKEYLANACAMVDRSVATYRDRGFRSLMVSFGCTGGQHRSVYLAEQLGAHLRAQGVDVVVAHTALEKRSR